MAPERLKMHNLAHILQKYFFLNVTNSTQALTLVERFWYTPSLRNGEYKLYPKIKFTNYNYAGTNNILTKNSFMIEAMFFLY